MLNELPLSAAASLGFLPIRTNNPRGLRNLRKFLDFLTCNLARRAEA